MKPKFCPYCVYDFGGTLDIQCLRCETLEQVLKAFEDSGLPVGHLDAYKAGVALGLKIALDTSRQSEQTFVHRR